MNIVSGVIGGALPAGTLREGVLTEIWTGELVKSLRAGLEGTWLDGVPDSSSVVNNDVIHLVDVGVDPDVLINNTTYPITLQELKDGDISISLDKFQTKVTPITDDELYALSYDKIARVKESHANAINDSKFAKSAHALCANEDTATTPVLTTTGSRDEKDGAFEIDNQRRDTNESGSRQVESPHDQSASGSLPGSRERPARDRTEFQGTVQYQPG